MPTASDEAGRPAPVAGALSDAEAEDLARRNGLTLLTARPPFADYVRDLWQRRGFVLTLSQGRTEARYQNNRLGRLWSVFNPMLLILSYFLIFGVLLGTRRGVDNFIGFLSIGVIVFGVSGSVISSGARSITGNTGLVRALRFPRAVLPISVGVTEVLAALPAFGVLVVLMLFSGERPTWTWLLLPVAVLLQLVQVIGLALIAARITHGSRDLANLIPLLLRLLRYTSGVFFSISHYTARAPSVGHVLEYQPFALQLETVRQSLLAETPLELGPWVASVIWAVVLLGGGLVFFWRGEATYGRG